MKEVYVTGFGIISSLGWSLDEHLNSLRTGTSGIRAVRHFQSNYAKSHLFGEVDFSDEELRTLTQTTAERTFTRTTLLALHSFTQAIQAANLSTSDLQSPATAFISSSTVGGMCYTDDLYADANKISPSSNYLRSYESSDHTLRLVRHFGMTGYTDTLNTACSSSANAVLLGVKLIQSGKADRVIVGGADCLAKFTVNGFNSLMILSDQPCRPFDEHRTGLSLGEAGAYLVLESSQASVNKFRYARVSGCGNASDAFHPSATSDDAMGPRLAMLRALDSAGLLPGQIDYINAHGTGTPNNDVTESYALSKVFDRIPPYNSTKSYTGHTLAASGAVELIFSLLSMLHAELYPSLNCIEPIRAFDFKPIDRYQTNASIRHVLSNSFGFGGNCTSIVLSSCS
jgi:3-oxoacyl-(acyl-carrier-protein) synthase